MEGLFEVDDDVPAARRGGGSLVGNQHESAPLAVRMERNRSEQRRLHKNPYWVTDAYLQQTDATHRYDSGGAFPLDVPHLRLETARLSAEAAANRIVEHFDLPRLADFSDGS